MVVMGLLSRMIVLQRLVLSILVLHHSPSIKRLSFLYLIRLYLNYVPDGFAGLIGGIGVELL